MTFPQQKSAVTTIIAIRPAIRKTLALGLLTSSLLAFGNSFAADPQATSNADIEARYQREKASCSNGQSNEDRATCLREAGAAYQQARQGKLNSLPAKSYRENALERCKMMPLADQADCRRRIDNPADSEGSASSGGILRKDVTIIPAPAR